MTPPTTNMSAPFSGRRTPNHVEHGVNEDPTVDIVQTTFLRNSCATSMGTLQATFLVDEDLAPINIEKIPSI